MLTLFLYSCPLPGSSNLGARVLLHRPNLILPASQPSNYFSPICCSGEANAEAARPLSPRPVAVFLGALLKSSRGRPTVEVPAAQPCVHRAKASSMTLWTVARNSSSENRFASTALRHLISRRFSWSALPCSVAASIVLLHAACRVT